MTWLLRNDRWRISRDRLCWLLGHHWVTFRQYGEGRVLLDTWKGCGHCWKRRRP